MLPDGVFTKLKPSGPTPSPRAGHSGWSFGKSVYYFGGQGPDPTIRGCIQGGDRKGDASNQLLEYSPDKNVFSLCATSGTPPSPRYYHAVGVINHLAFVHGGFDGEVLGDLYQLNMLDWTWTKLASTPRPLYTHSISPVSPTKLVLVGGAQARGGNSISNEVLGFDAVTSEWSQHQLLPEEVTGKDGGLKGHRAVSLVRDGKVAKVVVLGGSIDAGWTKHPHQVLRIDLTK
jgi:hypothetical protein